MRITLKTAAHHEAGHALVYYFLSGSRIESIDLKRRNTQGGMTIVQPKPSRMVAKCVCLAAKDQDKQVLPLRQALWLFEGISALFGGAAAEELVNGASRGHGKDELHILKLLKASGIRPGPFAKELCGLAFYFAAALISKERAAFDALAAMLLRKRLLLGQEAAEILENHRQCDRHCAPRNAISALLKEYGIRQRSSPWEGLPPSEQVFVEVAVPQ